MLCVQSKHDALLEKYRNNNRSEIIILRNKQPIWDAGYSNDLSHYISSKDSVESRWKFCWSFHLFWVELDYSRL